MERTLISLNAVNFVTIGIMALGFFFALALVWQLVSRALGSSDAASAGDASDVEAFVVPA